MGIPVPNFYDYNLLSRIGDAPVTAEMVAAHLKFDPDLLTDADFKAYIDALIDAAILAGEHLSKRVIWQANFGAYLDSFVSYAAYTVRRSPLKSVTAIQYYNGGTPQTLAATDYYKTNSPDYSKIAMVDGKDWPVVDCRLQAIELTFVAGYDAGAVPKDLLQAILIHVAAMYANRGDCAMTAAGAAGCVTCAVPTQAKNFYMKYRIHDLRQGM